MADKVTLKIHGTEFEVPEAEAITYRRLQNRIRYLETIVKLERFDKNRAVLVPSKEDSLDRLCETGREFAAEQQSVEDTIITNAMLDKLRQCLGRLTPNERALIYSLFFQGKSELEYARECRITQQAISKRLRKVLQKLGNMLNLKNT